MNRRRAEALSYRGSKKLLSKKFKNGKANYRKERGRENDQSNKT